MLFRALVLMLAQQMPFATVARIVGESAHRCTEVCNRYVEMALGLADFSGVTSVIIQPASSLRLGSRVGNIRSDGVRTRMMVHTMKDQVRGSTRPRRQHEREYQDDLIVQSLVPGASVAAIAMKGGINANLLLKWRREHVRAKTESAPAAATLLPVCVVADAEHAPTSPPPTAGGAVVSQNARPGVIEIEIAGAQLRLRGAVDETASSSVLRELRKGE